MTVLLGVAPIVACASGGAERPSVTHPANPDAKESTPLALSAPLVASAPVSGSSADPHAHHRAASTATASATSSGQHAGH